MESMPAGQKVPVNGVELYYVKKGNGPHVVLMIPGGLTPCEWCFASQLDHFGKDNGDYTVITFEQRGYGFSRPYDRKFTFQGGPHHCKTDAIDAYALMEKLGYSKFSILGFCDGGVTAIFLAALYPSAVTHLVVWGSRTFITDYDVNSSAGFQKEVAAHPGWAKLVFPLYDGYPKFAAVQQNLVDALRAHAASKDNDVCTKEMMSIECPTLIIRGGKDIFTRPSQTQHMKKCIKHSVLQIVPNGKHGPHLSETSKEFNERVEYFLSCKAKL